MGFSSIRGCGKVYEFHKQFGDVESKIKTGQFLKETLEEFARVSSKIFNSTADMPFWHKERQLSSIFLPCFYNLGYGALQEAPTRRKALGEASAHGWLDYWVQKDGNYVFLLEVKHGWLYLKSEKFNKPNEEKWDVAIKQLKSICKEERESLLNGMKGHCIALMVMPIWRNLDANEKYELHQKCPTPESELSDLAKRIMDSTKSKPNWVGIWSLPESMQYVFESNQIGRHRVLPGVMMMATLV